jgi:hypothetical protein
MARGDLTILEQGSMTGRGARLYNVAAGTLILAGEPVQLRAVGNTVVEPSLTGTPVVGTSGVEGLFVGVAATDSTNTSTAAGKVWVNPVSSGTTYLIAPAVAATFGQGSTPVQATYDALVGKRVLLQNSYTVGASNLNAGTYSVLASDSASNGVVIQAMNVLEHPGKVAIAFRGRTGNLS